MFGELGRAALAIIDGVMYVCGGLDVQQEPLSSCARFNPRLGRREELPPLPLPRARAAAVAMHVNRPSEVDSQANVH